MSTEALKHTGIVASNTRGEPRGCLPGFLRTFVGISQPTQQPVVQTIQVSNPSVELLDLDFSATIGKIIGLPERDPAKEIALSSVCADAEPTSLTRQSLTYEERQARFLAVNSYAKNIAEVSGIRELFRQTYAIVEQRHLKTILAEGFDTWSESDRFHLRASFSADYMNPSNNGKQVYRIVLSWPMEGHEKYGRYFMTGDHFKNRMHDGEELSYFYIGAVCFAWKSWEDEKSLDSGEGKIRILPTKYSDPIVELTEKDWRDREIIKRAIIVALERPGYGRLLRRSSYYGGSGGINTSDWRDKPVAT